MCSSRAGRSGEILNLKMTQELKELLEYGNRFHHDTNPSWETELINATELSGLVKRTLAFASPPGS